jgi:2,3,4,5-tetrahydropyridine-2-carboxylate N-succinyltransferase
MNIKATGLITKSSSGETLDAYFPVIEFNDQKTDIQDISTDNLEKEVVEIDWTQKDLDKPIEDFVSAYIKLHLISYRFVLPNSINLDGLFNALPNVAWTNKGPISIDEIDQELLNSKQNKNDLFIRSLDKFPQLVDYIIPKNVRIADTSRVRLGAYLSPGTTIMHEGFVNFNAGTLGTAMIEGRISAGVVVGDNSDLGGGCSTMGTLSGGNNIKISIGENCLIGANAGVGIPLGDNCTIEAGLYITAGTKIEVYKENGDIDGVFKGSELSNCSNLVFLRNSQNGKVFAKVNQKSINLNSELHKND